MKSIRLLLVIAAAFSLYAAAQDLPKPPLPPAPAGIRFKLVSDAAGAAAASVLGNVHSALAGPAEYDVKTRQYYVPFASDVGHIDPTIVVNALRRNPGVLWAEIAYPASAPSRELLAIEAQEMVNHLLLKETRGMFSGVEQLGERMSQAMGVSLAHSRDLWDGTRVFRFSSPRSVAEVKELAARLVAQGIVEYAEPDRIQRTAAFPDSAPNDPRYAEQWDLAEWTGDAGNLGTANLVPAWRITRGSNNTVVAVVDSGETVHPDLQRIVGGADLISDPARAADGNGRDADPTDEGDFCNGNNSTWHGTHVAGTIGAATDNGQGVAGVAPNVRMQHVRVLGKCGGTFQDIADGIAWAAGAYIADLPTGIRNNLTPARVINLSLGGVSACPTTYQNAIDFALSQGAIVVVAAGNDRRPASDASPANCQGVITVHSHTKFGDYAAYTNFGPTISISAPGGQIRQGGPRGPDGGILSTLNSGTTLPSFPTYAAYEGTSMATPHVAGVAALMLARYGSGLTPSIAKAILESSSREFPIGSSCALDGGCGAGMLDAYTALTDQTILTVLFQGATGSVTSNPAGITCTEDCANYMPYDETSVVTLTAVPSGRNTFLGWAGACTGTGTCQVTPNRSKTVIAKFAPGAITLTGVKSRKTHP